jgi:glycine cleavage system transcriptional repressor
VVTICIVKKSIYDSREKAKQKNKDSNLEPLLTDRLGLILKIRKKEKSKHNQIYPNNGSNPMNKVILSVLGHDCPGIVAAVARVLFEQNCNIENVSQTILQTEFAGSFIVTLPENLPREDLRDILLEGLASLDMHVHIAPLADKATAYVTKASEPFVITTRGPDRKGLVAGISAILARYGVNITNLKAVFKGGDEPGANIMIYEVDIPVEIDTLALYRDLREEAQALKLDISIQHRNIFETINRI